MDRELSEEALQDLYAWIDNIPLSRPKKHITRDFSDGVMAAEVGKHFFPKMVELHNYSPANSTQQKISNWNLLNRKVFSKLNFYVSEETIKKIVLSTPGVIESVLAALRDKIDLKLEHTGENILELEYYDIKNHQKLHTEVDPALILVREKDMMALQDTVEVLRMKVNKLEHLVHLKDIEDPTRHLGSNKTKAKSSKP